MEGKSGFCTGEARDEVAFESISGFLGRIDAVVILKGTLVVNFVLLRKSEGCGTFIVRDLKADVKPLDCKVVKMMLYARNNLLVELYLIGIVFGSCA